jgi:hypothetical protein
LRFGKASTRLLNPPMNFSRGMHVSLPPHVIQSDEIETYRAIAVATRSFLPSGRKANHGKAFPRS